MSSNNDFFRHQNEIIRNTWGKDVDVLFYEGDYYIDNINGDVIRKLWENPEACIELGNKARLDYENKYMSENNYEQIIRIYESV